MGHCTKTGAFSQIPKREGAGPGGPFGTASQKGAGVGREGQLSHHPAPFASGQE